MDGEPLKPDKARRLIGEILVRGKVAFSGHALQEMAKDHMTQVDVSNVLRGGLVGVAEERKGTWRYPVATRIFTVVVAFRSMAELRSRPGMSPRFSLGLGAVFFVAPAVAYLSSDTLPPKRLEYGPHPGAILHALIPGRLLKLVTAWREKKR